MPQTGSFKKVLIAHQSTIPHYRIPFYNALEQARPAAWCFEVVFDPVELSAPKFFLEPLDAQQFHFPTMPVRSYSARIAQKTISYQTFWRTSARYDLIIVEQALNNLTYPLCQLHQLHRTKFAFWGHGKDRSIARPSAAKLISEKLKLFLTRFSDGFFAYTPGVKHYLVSQGISPAKIFTVNNTIDILDQRRVYAKWLPQREEQRELFNLQGKKVLLFVGRFTKNKRVDFLLQAFCKLRAIDRDFHLLLVGSEGDRFLQKYQDLSNITYFGPVVDLDKLAPIYVASDVFAFPGSVGLGPLQALCYDLPILTIDSPIHMPEIEYLSKENSILLGSNASPAAYATEIKDLFDHTERLNDLRSTVWPSIRYLTIEQMAQNFITGINMIFDRTT